MRLIKTAATGLIALSSIALVACQKEVCPTPAATSASVYDTGKLRVVIGKALPMVEKNADNYDGLSLWFWMRSGTRSMCRLWKRMGRRHRARGRELTQRRTDKIARRCRHRLRR